MTLLLQLRNELWKLFGKRRTYIGCVMFMIAQSAIIMLFKFNLGPFRQVLKGLQRSGFDAEHYLSCWTIASNTLAATGYILLPLYVALVGGDIVAKEAEDGTLRMILARPVSRLRLLLLKWAAGIVFAYLLAAFVGTFGILLARCFFPNGGLFVFLPIDGVRGTFDGSAVWQRYVVAHLVVGVKATAVMTLAFMFSCLNIKPAAATIMCISIIFISFILQQIPYFSDLAPWFLTYHLNIWTQFFQDPIPWWRIAQSFCILGAYVSTFLIIGCTAFHMRDIKS